MNLLHFLKALRDKRRAKKLRKHHKEILIRIYFKDSPQFELFTTYQASFGKMCYIGDNCFLPLDFNPIEVFPAAYPAIDNKDFSKN
jgi:hypothetical protein